MPTSTTMPDPFRDGHPEVPIHEVLSRVAAAAGSLSEYIGAHAEALPPAQRHLLLQSFRPFAGNVDRLLVTWDALAEMTPAE